MIQLKQPFTSLYDTPPSFDELMAIEGEVFSEGVGRVVMKFTVKGQNFFIKKHFGVGWGEIFKELSNGKKPVLGAENEWQALQFLAEHNIPTMEWVGYGKRGTNPAKQESFIITKELPATISLEKYTALWAIEPPSFTEKRKLITQVASLAKVLHQHGFIHRDFYLCHIHRQPETGQLYLIDLHRAERILPMPFRWQVKELGSLYYSAMRLGLTRRDILRFIQGYTDTSLKNTLSIQQNLWQAVKVRANSLMAKAIRKGIL